jgi:hypothetical protein
LSTCRLDGRAPSKRVRLSNVASFIRSPLLNDARAPDSRIPLRVLPRIAYRVETRHARKRSFRPRNAIESLGETGERSASILL